MNGSSVASNDVMLYAPLVLSRCRQTGRVKAHMPSKPMAFCSSALPLKTLYDAPSRFNILAETRFGRRISVWAQQHSAQLAAMTTLVKRRLLAYQQAALHDHGVHIEIDWDAVSRNVRDFAYRSSSSSSSSYSFHCATSSATSPACTSSGARQQFVSSSRVANRQTMVS